MMREDFSPRKKRLLVSGNPSVSGTIDAVRDPQNPVKVRAENRARELGTTLHEVYQRVGISRNYLTYMPKNGWREDLLRQVALALDWNVDQLLYGPEDDEAKARRLEAEREERERLSQDVSLLEIAIEVAVQILSEEAPGAGNGPNVGRLSRILHESLQRHVVSPGEPQPSEQSLLIWGRLLIAALRDRSTRS